MSDGARPSDQALASQDQGLGPLGFDPSRVGVPSTTRNHDVLIGYDHNTCGRCYWVQPDMVHKQGTASTWEEWFPSMDAFAHFKKTGVRAWIGGSRCDAIAIEARSDATGTGAAEGKSAAIAQNPSPGKAGGEKA